MGTTLGILVLLGILALIAINAGVAYVILRRQKNVGAGDQQSMSMLNQNIQGMQERLDKVSTGINERLDNAARVIGGVSKELGTVQEIGRSMQSLQTFLQSPKMRGNIGEQVLQQMLDQYFPSHLFDMQYRFQEGQIVDAVLKTDNGFIPIDAKFPMENYQRMAREQSEEQKASFQKEFVKDVKKHVNDIARKYILPDEGTVDFAIMYIPSEAVYYEIIRNDIDINSHGLERKVMFVSPNSFYYFLRILMMGMQEKQIAEAAKEIIAALRGIQKDAERFNETLGVLNTHITHAKTALDKTTTEYAKLSGKISKVDQISESKLLE